MLSPEREGRLTASQHATALGLGYDSPAKAWRIWNKLEDFSEEAKARMGWGQDHEIDAVGAFEAHTGELVTRTGDDQLWTPWEDWSGCTTDGLIGEDGILECKCPVRLYENPPDAYWVQVQSQLHFTGRAVAWLSAWTPTETAIWETKKWPEYWMTVEHHLKKFWEMMKSTEPPGRTKKLKLGLPITWTKIR